MKRKPANGWTIEDAIKLCRGFGVRCMSPAGGAHYVIGHPSIDGLLTVPAKAPLKPLYVLLLVELLEAVIENKKWAKATGSPFAF